LRRIAAADPEGKTILLPGDHVDSTRHSLRMETEQRQAALDAASVDADWVIQLDTDEIAPVPQVLQKYIRRADEGAAGALAYPARTIYARTASGAFLEHCGRLWTTQSSYPGPMAVRAGTSLSHARQAASAPVFRVDVSPWNTDPAHARTTPVHAVVGVHEAIIHMSWVRSASQMAEKSAVSGHASERDWPRELQSWGGRSRHPVLTTLRAPFTRDPFRRFRIAHLPEYAQLEP
jgi:hypothetical protein